MSREIVHFSTEFSLYSGCMTFVAGVVGNILNFLVFTQLKLFQDNRCAFYLSIESIANLLYQCVSVSLTILISIDEDDATGRSSLWCKFRYILISTCVLITSSMICFAAVDQFSSTNHRYGLRQMCTLKLARYLSTTVVCLWIAHSIVFGLFFDIQPLFGCVISNPIWLQYSMYFYFPVLCGVLPISVSSFFAILAYQNVRRLVRRQMPIVRRRLDRQMTAMVLSRVIVFVCLLSPYTAYCIYIIKFPIPRNEPIEYATGRLVQAILVFFASLNYTVSFYVFVISLPRFRRQVKLVLMKKCWRRVKTWCYPRRNQVVPDNTNLQHSNVELGEG